LKAEAKPIDFYRGRQSCRKAEIPGLVEEVAGLITVKNGKTDSKIKQQKY